jgi:hypothetical protein
MKSVRINNFSLSLSSLIQFINSLPFSPSPFLPHQFPSCQHAVQDQLNRLNETVPQANKENEQGRLVDFETVVDSNKKLKSKLTSSGSKAGIKIRGQASRIVSSFKTQSIVCTLVRDFSGVHNDGKFLMKCPR